MREKQYKYHSMKPSGWITLFATLLLSWKANGQLIDNSLKVELIEQQVKLFSPLNNIDDATGQWYVNGEIYYCEPNTNYHPFFIEDKWVNGTIKYLDEIYDVKGLKYDLIRDCLVLFYIQNDQVLPIVLNPQFTSDFNINNHYFRYLQKDIDGNIATGYYEVVYDGETKYFVKWKKNIKINSSTRNLEASVIKHSYLLHNSEYTKVKGRISLVKSLDKEYRKQIRDYLRTHKIYISSDMDDFADGILEYYDNLGKRR